ncbi:MAG: hypothetical protein ABIP07_08200, partial [Sphingomicrobium sp.]
MVLSTTNLWWQIPPSGKIYCTAVGRKLAVKTFFLGYADFGTDPASVISNREVELEFSMGIFSRTRDIFAANMTELLDRAEDPARMIRMIILEMEET